jgi:hypothetical protein
MNNSKHSFYLSVWNKYLPIIRILLKKSAAEEQVLSINRIDIERAGGIRKSGYRFVVNFVNGRPDALFSGNDLVQTFISVLQNDEVINDHLSKNDYTFTFTNKYQLQIKNNGSQKQTVESLAEEETTINQ